MGFVGKKMGGDKNELEEFMKPSKPMTIGNKMSKTQLKRITMKPMASKRGK